MNVLRHLVYLVTAAVMAALSAALVALLFGICAKIFVLTSFGQTVLDICKWLTLTYMVATTFVGTYKTLLIMKDVP